MTSIVDMGSLSGEISEALSKEDHRGQMSKTALLSGVST
jgi:hypothetical protein